MRRFEVINIIKVPKIQFVASNLIKRLKATLNLDPNPTLEKKRVWIHFSLNGSGSDKNTQIRSDQVLTA